jgi:hypothetical protein
MGDDDVVNREPEGGAPMLQLLIASPLGERPVGSVCLAVG